MSFKDSKVVIVGVGNVGATTAYSILNQYIKNCRYKVIYRNYSLSFFL